MGIDATSPPPLPQEAIADAEAVDSLCRLFSNPQPAPNEEGDSFTEKAPTLDLSPDNRSYPYTNPGRPTSQPRMVHPTEAILLMFIDGRLPKKPAIELLEKCLIAMGKASVDPKAVVRLIDSLSLPSVLGYTEDDVKKLMYLHITNRPSTEEEGSGLLLLKRMAGVSLRLATPAPMPDLSGIAPGPGPRPDLRIITPPTTPTVRDIETVSPLALRSIRPGIRISRIALALMAGAIVTVGILTSNTDTPPTSPPVPPKPPRDGGLSPKEDTGVASEESSGPNLIVVTPEDTVATDDTGAAANPASVPTEGATSNDTAKATTKEAPQAPTPTAAATPTQAPKAAEAPAPKITLHFQKSSATGNLLVDRSKSEKSLPEGWKLVSYRRIVGDKRLFVVEDPEGNQFQVDIANTSSLSGGSSSAEVELQPSEEK